MYQHAFELVWNFAILLVLIGEIGQIVAVDRVLGEAGLPIETRKAPKPAFIPNPSGPIHRTSHQIFQLCHVLHSPARYFMKKFFPVALGDSAKTLKVVWKKKS